MIKSAHLTASISRKAGGLLDAVSRLVQTHDAGRMEVKVFGLRDEFSDSDLIRWNPVPVSAFPAIWPAAIGRSPEFMDALFAFEPDIVHTHGLWLYPSIAAKNYSRKTGRPHLISPHGMLDPWALANSRWKKKIAGVLFENGHLRGARCLRALCESEAQSIRRLRLGNPIAVIPNGIDLPDEKGAGVAGTPLPWLGFVEPGKKVLLFLSRIHPKKGLVNLLKAFAQNRQSDGWVLAVAGWDQGGHEQDLKRLATDLGLVWSDIRDKKSGRPGSSLVFLGPQFNQAKAACYLHCDAFVLPSFSEGLPMVVLEAWANSKPVLMTPECNLPAGFVAGAAIRTEADVASLANGLKELTRLGDADLLAMGGRARGLVEERFTWPCVAGQMAEVYQWILGGGSRPACMVDA